MGIKLTTHIDFPDEIIIRKFEGVIQPEDVLLSWENIKSSPLLTTSTKGIISDLSKCDFRMDLNGFQKIINYLKNQEYLKPIKLAVITDSPKDIVFPMIGESTVKSLQIKPFNTESAATRWIMNL